MGSRILQGTNNNTKTQQQYKQQHLPVDGQASCRAPTTVGQERPQGGKATQHRLVCLRKKDFHQKLLIIFIPHKEMLT